MKINIENLTEILNPHLTAVYRGILITILLLRDEDPYITLAKLRRDGSILKHKEDLIWLHEKKYIDWSGYKAAKRQVEGSVMSLEVVEIMTFLNDLYGTKFRLSGVVDSNLRARLKDYSIDDIKLVIANRYSEWKDDSVMSKYLTPHTIFRPSKFDKYLVEAQHTRKGLALVAAVKNNLKKGDELTIETSQTLIDEEVYDIRIDTYQGFKRLGQGSITKKYGRDIKRMLNTARMVGGEDFKAYYES